MVSSATGIPPPATTAASADPLLSQADSNNNINDSRNLNPPPSTAPPTSAEPLRSGSSGSIPTTLKLKNALSSSLSSTSTTSAASASTILLHHPLPSSPTPASVSTSTSASASTSTISLLPTSPSTSISREDHQNNHNSKSNNNKAPSSTRTTSSTGGGSSSSLAQQSLRQNQLRADKSQVAKEMLLLHTSGSVKVGEIMRYTITYNPIHDRILPPPSALHLRIKNTEPIPMRAAYLHGPYVLYVSAKSSTYDQWTPVTDPREEGGYPEFDPNLRPGGSWECQLPVPRRLRTKVMEKERSRRLSNSGGRPLLGHRRSDNKVEEKEDSVTWVVEVVSQMIFSSTSRIHFDLLLGRDERSLSQFNSVPLDEGSYSRAITFKVQNTEQLWNTPAFPGENEQIQPQSQPGRKNKPKKNKGPKKVHLVMISHGLHSNTGADMLYLKESIDRSAARALESSRKRRKEGKNKEKEMMEQRKKMEEEAHKLHKEGELTRRLSHVEGLPIKEVLDEIRKEAEEAKENDVNSEETKPEQKEAETEDKSKPVKAEDKSQAPKADAPKADALKGEALKDQEPPAIEAESESDSDDDSDDDDEQVITRGFHDNVCRTERGIKYLGKRLARHVFALTYPNRPFPPSLRDKQHAHRSGTFPLHLHNNNKHDGQPDAAQKAKDKLANAKYKVTSISFIGHSLGGLVQTYAIAYIHAHSPEFFREVEPVNFIALASPFLGLSNENPIYIRFALDFGVVGKTGQDLGLSWRPPTAFSAFTGVGGAANTQEGNNMAGTKPLLRILPTGPAKEVLHMFRNRTVYANVVNDGIVPLRTSCLLFLDWKGLGRVEKARRTNEGPVGQVSGLVGWGWGQLISGQGEKTHKRSWSVSSKKSDQLALQQQQQQEQESAGGHLAVGEAPRTDERPKSGASTGSSSGEEGKRSGHPAPNPFSALLTLFRPHTAKKKAAIYKRSQVIPSPTFPPSNNNNNGNELPTSPRSPIAEREVTRSPEAVSPVGAATATATAAGAEVDEMDPTKNHLGEDEEMMEAPPRTTLLEAAGDVLNPPLPTLEYIINPNKRPRTIFHDRVYHPNDIPPVPARTRRTLSRAGSATYAPTVAGNKDGKDGGKGGGSESRNSTNESLLSAANSSGSSTNATVTTNNNPSVAGGTGAGGNNNGGTKSNMRPEEKIARAYHEGLSWRKVLVRLEPDAHNNIIVRREFSNAYGWPVVKHLCDTHFEDTYESRIRDDDEGGEERALEIDAGVWKGGEEVTHHRDEEGVGVGGRNVSGVPAVGAGNVDDDYTARRNLEDHTIRERDENGKGGGGSGGANNAVSDGEDDTRMKFRRRLSAKRTVSFKRNRSTSPPSTDLLERADDSGVWSDSALFVSDDEDEEEENRRLIKRDEEVRRLRQIDSFLGKGKGGAVVGGVTPVSPPARSSSSRGGFGSGGSGGGASGSAAVGLSGLGGFGGLMGYEASQNQQQQKEGGLGDTAVERLTSLRIRDGEAERRREIGRKIESGMDAGAARRGSATGSDGR